MKRPTLHRQGPFSAKARSSGRAMQPRSADSFRGRGSVFSSKRGGAEHAEESAELFVDRDG
jgi:hypothetical protein